MNKRFVEGFIREIKNDDRMRHSIGVLLTARALSDFYGFYINDEKIYKAALLHDVTKNYSLEEQRCIIEEHEKELFEKPEFVNTPAIWHAVTSSIIAKTEYGVTDQEILDAIRYHTTGRPNMSNLEKIIFLADFIEISRSGKCYENVRKNAFYDFDYALIQAYEETFMYLESKKQDRYPLSFEGYKYLCVHYNDEKKVKKEIKC